MDIDMLDQPNDDFDQKSDMFMTWLQSQPAVQISPKIALQDYRSDNAGRGVVAVQDIAEGELLFAIPKSTMLATPNSDLSARIPQVLADLENPWLCLILTMMYESARPDSRWAPYLAILPEAFSTPMFWSEEELTELKGTAVLDKVGRAEADETYQTKIVPVIEAHPDLFPREHCTLENFHRMGSLILSYSFDVEKAPADGTHDADEDDLEEEEYEKSMCPLADLLNADVTLCNARLFYSADSLEMKAIQTIPASEQIYNTYGDLPNADSLRRYGYVKVGGSEYDVLEISAPVVTDAAGASLSEKDREVRIDYLLEEGVLEDGFDIDAAGEVPEELLITIHTLQMGRLEFKRHRDAEKVPKPRKTKKAQEILLSILDAREKEYPTTLEEDEAKLREANVSLNLRNALEVRIGEKRILKKCNEDVQSWATEEAEKPKTKRSRDEDAEGKGKKARK
ncbi:Ribosomal lysine N-methyltransferase 4 [Saitoella coloradoensis]